MARRRSDKLANILITLRNAVPELDCGFLEELTASERDAVTESVRRVFDYEDRHRQVQLGMIAWANLPPEPEGVLERHESLPDRLAMRLMRLSDVALWVPSAGDTMFRLPSRHLGPFVAAVRGAWTRGEGDRFVAANASWLLWIEPDGRIYLNDMSAAGHGT